MNHKKIISYVFLFGIILAFASCKTISNTTVTSDIQGPTVVQRPVVADLDVKETRVTGTYITKRSMSEVDLKQMAIADALKKANADVLIEPRYEISSSMRETTVTVSGYPATYKGFRPMEIQDTIFIQNDGLSTATADRQKPKKSTRNKRIAAWTSGGVVGVVGLLFLIWFF